MSSKVPEKEESLPARRKRSWVRGEDMLRRSVPEPRRRLRSVGVMGVAPVEVVA